MPPNSRSPWHCSVCGEQFRSIEGILESDKVVTCSKCHKKVCRKKCSKQDQSLWICQVCQQPESWFKGILKALNPNQAQAIGTKTVNNMDVGKIDEVEEDLEVIKNKEKEQVREFIERLVEAMLGGGIDNISITRLYNDQRYETIMNRYHNDLSNTLTDLGSALHMSIANLPIVGQSPCSAHAGLKLLIQRIIQEAIGLPSMKKIADRSSNSSEISDRTYEDLLSTAIINKIVQNYQEDAPSSSANSASSQHSASSNPNKEFYFGEETLETKWKKPNSTGGDPDTASVSSIEEWVRSDSSTGSTKYVDHRSLTIKREIKEASSSDEDEVTRIKHKKSNWKENWTLQKRNFAGTASPIPVPMLVPNPTTEAKVLIGDREAEDTSDLSDLGSDYGEIEKAPGIESLLVDSKTVIGGKNGITKINVENEIQSDECTDTSEIVEEKERILDQIKPSPEATQCLNIKGESIELSSFDSHIEQDTEYTERYATLPKTIIKESSEESKVVEESSQLTNGNHKAERDTKDATLEEDDQTNEAEFKGSYSVREKQKWENAIEMKNNPYTTESINKRLIKSTYTDVSSLFGRDYYIKEAARAAGARKTNTEDGDEMLTPTMQQPQSNYNGFVYQAVPAIVDPEESQFNESDSPILTSPIPPNLLEISSDSDLSIERVYNLNSGKVYETVGGVHKEFVKRSASPEGIKFTPHREFDKTFTITDENHNSTMEKKRSFLKSLTESEVGGTTVETDVFQEVTIANDSAFSDTIIENNASFETIISENNNVPLRATTEERVAANNFIIENTNGRYSIQEFSLEFSTDGENRTSAESSLNINSDPEIIDLKDKHLVKDKLGMFSKSYPNLGSTLTSKKNIKKEHSFNSGESVQQVSEVIDTSVNDLRKKFDHVEDKDGNKKQIHSLTARSISQTIRKELQDVDTHAADSINNAVIREEELVVEGPETNYFPDAKSRIKFFENLNR